MELKMNVVNRRYKMLVHDRKSDKFKMVEVDAESLTAAKMQLGEDLKFIQLYEEAEKE